MMYEWLWHRLPGPIAVKIMLCAVLFCVVVLLCFQYLFPAISPYMPFNNVSVQ